MYVLMRYVCKWNAKLNKDWDAAAAVAATRAAADWTDWNK